LYFEHLSAVGGSGPFFFSSNYSYLPFNSSNLNKATDFTHTFTQVINTNLKSVFLLCQAAGQHMVPLKRGRIINFASLLSFQGGLTVPAYASSKGGVVQLTKALSNEWSKEGVCVNAIAPGYIETDMNENLLQDPVRLPQISERIPAGRWGRPEDFAGPVVFLASKASQYVCGEVLVVDGVSCSIPSWHYSPFRFPPIVFPNLFPDFSSSPSLGPPLYQ
jgi:NAD(P)-dependent dehydrogenase (short-subunit alcohol dehydrogenase family)